MPNWKRDLGALALAGVMALWAAPVLAQARALQCGGGAISAEARVLADEVNLARTNPKGYATLVEAYFAGLQGKRYKLGNVTMVMQEGRPAVTEAVRALKRQKPVPALDVSGCLSAAARDHVTHQGPRGGFGHVGPGGQGPSDRVARHVRGRPYCGENISYGIADPRGVVIQLIVDDGVPGRGHRKNIFDPRFRSLGTATGPHAKLRSMAVQVFCFNEVTGG